ncbi:ubiquitin-like domain-containing protein [Nonomuraea maritima]|uniref:ubiquitin-like domain-containing protein n=1 Tax=Nonomuraea maritima TaxID=683260 RepID=UPI00370FE5FC
MRGKRRAPRPPIPWRSPWTPALCVASMVALGGLVATSALVKDVVVVADGERRPFRGIAGTVGEVLDGAGVSVGLADVVRPATHEKVSDGATIEVLRARPITLTLDGRTSRHLVTATSVGEALAELDVTPAGGRLSAPPHDAVPLEGMELTVDTRRTVHVVTGTRRVSARTTARTVREVLRKEHISLSRGSQVNPPLGSFPEDGTVITVTPPRDVPVPPEVANLDWEALAECESAGDSLAYNPEGPYYGLYQFSLPMWRVVGGIGLPSTWPADEQTYRAQLLYQHVKGRWKGQWPTCGPLLFGITPYQPTPAPRQALRR